MHWEWVVPVIALVLWILNNLIRNADEKQARNVRRPAEPEGERPAERTTSDVDQFLEEINRMRRRSTPQRREEPKQPPVRSEEPAPVFVPTVVERPRPQQRPRPRPAEKPRTMVAKPVAVQVGAEIRDVIPVAPPNAPTALAPTRRPSPAVAQLWSMLRTPGSVQAAIMLQEVLGPPRCRKRR
jgi:hypothetical protein